MTLNSPTFLFLFLPVFILGHFIVGQRLRGHWLLLGSLIFLLWTDPLYFPIIVLISGLNYWFGRMVVRRVQSGQTPGAWLKVGIGLNLAALLFFKTFVTYWPSILQYLSRSGLELPGSLPGYLRQAAHMPTGFSYLVFVAIAFLADLARRQVQGPLNFLPVMNALLMFPRVLAGPIIRFNEVVQDLALRMVVSRQVAEGVRRFMIGFAKKTLIADQLALVTDRGIFLHPPATIPTGVAWLAIVCFALQIFYDFSGYTDMALGVGLMIGVRLPENFNTPYTSASITEFWRRWHITLSGWFRDYLFYPLERKRRTTHWLTQTGNILLVFLFTGLWHGLTPTYAAWGLVHGGAIALERTRFGGWLNRAWAPVRYGYTLLVVLAGWVFFRSPTLAYAGRFLLTLLGFSNPTGPLPFDIFPPVSTTVWVALVAAILFALPIGTWVKALTKHMSAECWVIRDTWAQSAFALLLFLLAITLQAASTFQPFIYGVY